MAFDADLHLIADRVADLLDRDQPLFDFRSRDALAEAALAELIEGPDFHRHYFIGQQAPRQRARVFVPGFIIANPTETEAGVVGGDLVARLAAQQVIERRAVVQPHDVPEGDFKGGKRARLGAGVTVVHDVIHHEAPESLDIERVLTQRERRDCAMQRRFGAGNLVDGFAQADQAAVGVDAHGEQARVGFPLQRFDPRDFHWGVLR